MVLYRNLWLNVSLWNPKKNLYGIAAKNLLNTFIFKSLYIDLKGIVHPKMMLFQTCMSLYLSVEHTQKQIFRYMNNKQNDYFLLCVTEERKS